MFQKLGFQAEMFGILSFYIELVVFLCFSNLDFSLKIARNARLGERVCTLEDTMRTVKMKFRSRYSRANSAQATIGECQDYF